MLARTQRIDRDRGLVLVVLAPVHQHFAFAQFLLHVGNHQLAVLIFQQAGEGMGKRFGSFVARFRIQRHVNLKSL